MFDTNGMAGTRSPMGRGRERAALRREENRGLRKQPISLEWDTILEDFKRIDLIPSQTPPS